ncbi:hypothetical protein COCNU_02G003210 [Cocos nucifera]|uniref:DUF7722 domain-containing protein n=1 Tax=Cocos nucifera TaxID=13894 RepID=A0A8K0HY20_COCNU|nr:hypothetical protein COCNU_02G003210 [Cocos nucifera]
MTGGSREYSRGRRVAEAEGKGRCGYFEMPLHYPRYTKAEYETMPEWKLDCLLREYGLPVTGNLAHKRSFAMGAFIWQSQTSPA